MPDPVILLHGAWQGASVWNGLTPVLSAAGWAPAAPELPGNGADGRDPGDITFATTSRMYRP
jgi:pimeloyl-ACP methyl ester carboxylesterase